VTQLSYAPLSMEQERMWLLAKLHGAVPGFHERGGVWIDGILDRAALDRAIEAIARRHEILRTRFLERDGAPCQVIAPAMEIAFRALDLSVAGCPASDAQALAAASAEVSLPFDLEEGPLWRVSLLRLHPERHLVVLCMHHIVSDGDWSVDLFFEELFEAYHGEELPTPQFSYGDYARFQRAHVTGELLASQIAFWRDELASAPPALELLTDRPRPAAQTFSGSTMERAQDLALLHELRSLAAREGADLFSLLLASVQALLHRYTAQDDILVGTPLPGRNHPDVQRVIGYFGNPVIVRGRLAANPSFQDLLRQVHETARKSRAHGDVSFKSLVEELAPPRDPSRMPLFQVLFDLRISSTTPRRGPQITMRPVDIDLPYVAYDLIFTFQETETGLSLKVEYNGDLFEPRTIAAMLEHWEVLIRGASADVQTPVSALPLMTAAERRKVMVDWSGPRAALAPEARVHELFAAQVRRTPDAIAVQTRERAVTYRELDQRANRLARRLASSASAERGTDQRIGLCVSRSVEMVVGMIGILKAGAAFVPLDPGYPSSALAFIFGDADLSALLMEPRLASVLPCEGIPVHFLTPEDEVDADVTDEAPRADEGGDATAYVIYTSGSTGKPKGVLVGHRSLVNHNRFAIERFGLGPGERVLQFASVSFDAALEEIFPTLLCGATLVLSPESRVISFEHLMRFAEEMELSVLDLPTAYWHEWVLELARSRASLPPSLRLVIVGGERALPERLAAWREIANDRVRWINTYGPTEATIICTCYEPAAADPSRAAASRLPIGRPIDNARVYVLDARMQAVPVGVPGELYVGGAAVAQGYLNRPGLTAAKFIPDPFGDREGARLYRTGDLVRWLPDGNIEFLGRADNQIKLRGYRIELEEIEAALREHPAVRDVAVLVREDTPGDRRLVAYIAPELANVTAPAQRAELVAEQVSEWCAIYEDASSNYGEGEAPTLQITGWNSSYTRQPIPAPEMREWRDHTVARICALRPRRVWEIGCGTGLVLLPLAPSCASYMGTDFAETTLNGLSRQVDEMGLRGVRIERREANRFEGIAPESFDTVILNSVVQYFPDLDYLLEVIRGAVRAVADGGVVFLGDVRNLDLLEAFHTSVELYQAPMHLTADVLRRRVERALHAEEELLLAPELFHRLCGEIPRLTHAEVWLKRGRGSNEMNRYRSDVVLFVGRAALPVRIAEERTWPSLGSSLDGLERWLRAEGPAAVEIVGVPNARVAGDLAASLALRVGEMLAGVIATSAAAAPGVELEDLWELGERLGYAVRVTWSRAAGAGCVDVLLERAALAGHEGWPRAWLCGRAPTGRALGTLASNPLQAKQEKLLLPTLKEHLRRRLPEYMQPAALVKMDALPRSASNKVDRRALPAPDDARPETLREFVSPRSEIEHAVASIWREVLRWDRLGVHDNFFELGGNSLHAVQMFSRIRNVFGVDVRFQRFFAHPTIAGLATLIKGERASLRDEPSLPRASRDRPLPLSFAQERLWFLQRLAPESTAYNCLYPFRLTGNLSAPALERSLGALIARHEILRTTYAEVDGRPVQIIAERAPFELERLDLEHLAPEDREAEALGRLDAEARQTFDLTRGPLLRAALVRLGPEDHILWLHFHHVTIDGWSIEIAFREIAALYQAFCRGARSPLSPVSFQYADFAVFQREGAEGAAPAELLAWWKRELTGAKPLIDLPLDHPRPSAQSFRGATLNWKLPPDLGKAVKALCVREEMTLPMVVLALYAVLLHRYSHEEDIVIGIPSANRDRVDLEGIMGFFVNTVPIRVDLSQRPSFQEVLRRVRRACLAAYEHDMLPFEQIVQELRPDRCPSYNPVVQVGFGPLPQAEHELRLDGLAVRYFEADAKKTILDISLYLWENGGEIAGMFEYSTDLFERATIERMASHLLALAAAAAAAPAQQLSSLSLLSDAERRQILRSWGSRAGDAPRGTSALDLFERQVARVPDAEAIVSPGGSLTYRELDRRANALAHRLRALGAGDETLIAICAERSIEMVVGILGAQKASAAYMPIDPEYAKDRLAFMLEDSGAPVLLTQAHLEQRLPPFGGAVIRLDEASDARADTTTSCEAPPPRQIGPGQLAYVIYTSGSTGRPKGVLLEHGGLANLVTWYIKRFQVDRADRATLIASPGFDASVWELWPHLCAGTSLFIPPDATRRVPAELKRWMLEQGITVSFVPTPLGEELLRLPWPEQGSLRCLQIAGDRLRIWPDASVPFEVVNNYGPTEGTVCATSVALPKRRASNVGAPEAPAQDPPIGRPIDNTTLYILDPLGEVVPPGVRGEIYIGGAGIARGYLRRPELTRERFVPDPFSEDPSARMYRTGDFARWLSDGQVEFLGRIDHQVKLRGYRIELGEVEAVLREHPAVHDAVVALRNDMPTGQGLVAYVVPKLGEAPAGTSGLTLQSEQVSEWKTLYEDTYQRSAPDGDASFNIVGWNSSYTGGPIEPEAMRAWRDHTVTRIDSLNPRRAWEIGCGSGLLLSQLAARCDEYFGTDFSAGAVSLVRDHLARLGITHVTVDHRDASDFRDIAPGRFDTIVLNSIIQYFPTVEYLKQVLEGAVRSVALGGVVFVGDVRSLPLLEAFHASVQAFRAAPTMPVAALCERARRATSMEEELALSPFHFAALCEEIPGVAHAEVWLKRGHGADEMTRFRYDVLLYVGEAPAPVAGVTSLILPDATGAAALAIIEQRLRERGPGALEVLGIPNARVYADVLAARQMGEASGTVAELIAAAAAAAASAVEPEALWDLGERLGYAVRVTWSSDAGPSHLDALFEPQGSADRPRAWVEARTRLAAKIEARANCPIDGKRARALLPGLRAFLKTKLPEHMVPTAFMTLEQMPLTSNGKIDRDALPAPERGAPEREPSRISSGSAPEERLRAIWRKVLGVEQVGLDDAFFELGGHSLLLAQVQSAIRAQLAAEVPIVDLFRYPTIRLLAAHLQTTFGAPRPFRVVETSTRIADVAPSRAGTVGEASAPAADLHRRPRAIPEDAIAIIGMSGRFPKAPDIESFWANLRAGVETISRYSAEELEAAGVDPRLSSAPNFVPAGGVIADSLCFDASFFGYSPHEAKTIDPQQRVFLECAWEALERAGYDPLTSPKSIGVFAGSDAPTYWIDRVDLHGAALSAEEMLASLGNISDNLTTRVAYKLGLRGPAITVLSACATSLVAVHLGCQSLLMKECDMALAGGVAIASSSRFGHVYEEGSINSPDGHCRPFDAEARGTVGGDGAGIVVLKRLAEALADGDTIHAVIRGSAISNDGRRKVSYTAPGLDGQLEAIARAHAAAGVSPESISFVEAHGTATRLGDPIEVAALTRAFRARTDKAQYCALGSVKSNVGHLGAAAGIAGLIKATLSLEREIIPPTVHFKKPNPALALEASPFFVNAEPMAWRRGEAPRRAGVSAFGVGGTNAHVVLEEAPEAEPSSASRAAQIVVVSARSRAVLDTYTERLAGYLGADPKAALADVAFTLQQGRAAQTHRRAVVCKDAATAAESLRERDPGRVFTRVPAERPPEVVFMFPGGGSQQLGMGQELYRSEPVYREAIDRCAALFDAELSIDLRATLYPGDAGRAEATAALLRPAVNMAAIFATEVAVAALLVSWGIRPAAFTGHSLGECVAAHLAGVLSLEDAAALTAFRGLLYEELPADAATLIVPLSEAKVAARLGEGCSLAAVNGPEACVVSGPRASVERLEAELLREGCEARRLPVSGAAHSALVEPLMHRLTQRAAPMKLRAPSLPLISNVTGRWMDKADAEDPAYWARHLRSTVRFADGVATLLADPRYVFVEVGPGRTLSALCRRHPAATPDRLLTPTMASAGSDRTELEALLCAVGQLWTAGVDIDWEAFSRGERRRRVPLPTYPFERATHVIEIAPAARSRSQAPPSSSAWRRLGALPFGSPRLPDATLAGIDDAFGDPVMNVLSQIWTRLLGVARVRPQDNFFDLGGSSLVAVQLRAEVQARLGVSLPVHALLEARTVALLADRIREAMPSAPSAPARTSVPFRAERTSAPVPGHAERRSLLVELKRGSPSGMPIFLIQPIGGTVYTYRWLAQSLSSDGPVYGIRASGMEEGEPILTDVASMAVRYLEEIRAIHPEGPYLLGGHSAGGVIAYEMAQMAQAASPRSETTLLMIDTPSLLTVKAKTFDTIEAIMQEVSGYEGTRSPGYDGFIAALREDTPFRSIVMTALHALRAYEPPPTKANLLYLRAQEQPAGNSGADLAYWFDITEGSCAVHKVPGDHFSMMDPPNVSAIAYHMQRHFDVPKTTRRSEAPAKPPRSRGRGRDSWRPRPNG
jgi:amino acid adenylation domain-containing protein